MGKVGGEGCSDELARWERSKGSEVASWERWGSEVASWERWGSEVLARWERCEGSGGGGGGGSEELARWERCEGSEVARWGRWENN